MVRLNHCGFSAQTTFYHIRIDGSLCQEVYCTDLFRFFFEDTDEFLTNNLSFLFWFGYTCQLVIISFLCIDTDKVQIELSLRSKDSFYFIAFVLS